jgi:MFS family permease
MPAALAAATDITPPEQRGRWLGLVGGGVSIGTIFGPTVGGVLYDAYGFGMPFYISAILAFIAVFCVWFMVPETRVASADTDTTAPDEGFLAVFRDPPRPVWMLLMLLWVDFVWVYAWVATEPAALALLYTDARYTATMFGVVVGALGVTTALSEFTLGSLSDRYGRLPLIALGLIVHVTWYIGVAYFSSYGTLIGLALISGFSVGLVTPALSAAYADIADPSQRGRIAGIKEMVLSLGGILGPLTAVLLTDRIAPQLILVAGTVLLVLSGSVIGVVAMRGAAIRRY